MKRFLWGVLAGSILFPVLYVARFFWKRRRDSITFDDTEWP